VQGGVGARRYQGVAGSFCSATLSCHTFAFMIASTKLFKMSSVDDVDVVWQMGRLYGRSLEASGLAVLCPKRMLPHHPALHQKDRKPRSKLDDCFYASFVGRIYY
jgi:hypothetical protein